jgi:hypothetical protein
MKPVVFLRMASVLTLIHSIMHTVGSVFGKPDPGAPAMVVATMQTTQFQAFGLTRSYWDFYTGLGMAVTIFLTADAIVFWLLGSLAKTDAARLRPILAVFLAGYLVAAANSSTYIFYGPAIIEVLIAACLGCAIFTAKPVEDAA